jgi:hypothetical protein
MLFTGEHVHVIGSRGLRKLDLPVIVEGWFEDHFF